MGFPKSFNEEKFVADYKNGLDQNDYDKVFEILNELPTFEPIIELYFSFVEELEKHTYTMQQLWAIAQLLYRLSNFNFVDVESPKPFPQHSLSSIANIIRNKKLKNSTKIDNKIKEIVKNLIKHYNIDIKRNNRYNNTKYTCIKTKPQLLLFIK